MKKICICGGGSLGHVIAGYLSANGKATVSILTNHPTAWQNKIEICVPDNGEMLTTTEICNMRAEANSDSDIVAILTKGEKVKKLENADENWIKVEYQGNEGYVYSDCLLYTSDAADE